MKHRQRPALNRAGSDVCDEAYVLSGGPGTFLSNSSTARSSNLSPRAVLDRCAMPQMLGKEIGPIGYGLMGNKKPRRVAAVE